MANAFIKAEQVVRTLLGMLEREIVLPSLVWRNPVGDFKGAKNDTVTVRMPAFTTARTRVLRGGRPITVDQLTETSLDMTLDTDVYKAVSITDEEMTLDIVSFGEQVLMPIVHAVAMGIEDLVALEMAGADYETVITLDEDDPYLGLVDAREALNNANVPRGGRGLVVGSSVETAILKSDRLSKFDQSGSDSALREASIGRIAGFDPVVGSNALDPDVAIAFHRTAFALTTVVPVIPDGVSWGAGASFAGIAMRTIKDYDFLNVQDRLLADLFAGTGTTKDSGTFNADGKFVPSEDGEDDPILVRAVQLTLNGS